MFSTFGPSRASWAGGFATACFSTQHLLRMSFGRGLRWRMCWYLVTGS